MSSNIFLLQMRLATILIQASLETQLAFMNHFPLFAIMLRVKDPWRLPGNQLFAEPWWTVEWQTFFHRVRWNLLRVQDIISKRRSHSYYRGVCVIIINLGYKLFPDRLTLENRIRRFRFRPYSFNTVSRLFICDYSFYLTPSLFRSPIMVPTCYAL